MTLFLLTWFGYSITEGYEDAWYKIINHNLAVVRRTVTGFCVFVAYYRVEIFEGFQWVYLSFLLMLAALFWVVFELSRNFAKHAKNPNHSLIYIGDEAVTDIFFKKHLGEWPTFFIRLIVLVIAITLQIVWT